jgi:hypothetical protein
MVNRMLWALVLCSGIASVPDTALADLRAQLFPLTGEVRLLNPTGAPVPFVFYSIESTSGALNGSGAVWLSIAENYDQPSGPTPGNGLIDPNGNWIKLSSAAGQLTEGALDADGGRPHL